VEILPEIARRKSPRAFQARPVEEEKLRLLLEAFRWAPSSYNKPPFVLMAIGYEEDVADLDERSREKELVPRTRKELREFAFRDRWGDPV
jgi:nitroreductase